MENILESYLVGLGFKIDDPSYRKFEDILARADSSVERHTSGMLKSVLKAQTGILGAFTAMSAAAIGLADKVAMADQGYRLFALQMLTTQETGRKLKLIMDGLGASMEQLIWDKELQGRAQQMSQWIDHLSQQLGPNFEKNMKGIRDIRMQFTELGQALQFLGMETVSKLFEKLGIDAGTLHQWLESFAQQIPSLAESFSTNLVPVLKDTWVMLKEIAGVGEATARVFTNLIGVLSGDSSLTAATAGFKEFGKAVQYVVQFFAQIFHYISNVEVALGHFLSAIGKLFSGNFIGAGKEVVAGVDKTMRTAVGIAYDTGKVVSNRWGAGESEEGKQFRKFLDGGYAGDVASGSPSGNSGVGSFTRNSSGGFDAIADAITRQEHGRLATINNNPGNMIYAGQAGASPGGEGGFAKFTDPTAGRQAIINQLRLDASRGLTLGQEIEKWAPRSDKRNNTDAYIRNVAARTGLDPSTRLSDVQMHLTVKGGDVIVQGTNASPAQIRKAAADGTMDGANRLAASQRQFVQAQMVPAT